MQHDVYMENRERITVTAVTGVDEFDESAVFVNLKEAGLVICGRNLHIEALDLEDGKLIATGHVESLSYTKHKERKSFFERFWK